MIMRLQILMFSEYRHVGRRAAVLGNYFTVAYFKNARTKGIVYWHW